MNLVMNLAGVFAMKLKEGQSAITAICIKKIS